MSKTSEVKHATPAPPNDKGLEGTGHTPGPWKRGDANTLLIVGPHTRFRHNFAGGYELAGIAYVEKSDDPGEDDANARLIASAPSLAAEVERLKAENKELREALETAATDGDYCFLCVQHPSHPGHAKTCLLSNSRRESGAPK